MVSWWQAGLGHLDHEAVWHGGLKSSVGPRLLQTFRGVTFQPAGCPVCRHFPLPDVISCGPQQLRAKNLRDTRSSGARTLALAILTGGPSQSDSSSLPLMGSSLLPGQGLCGGHSAQKVLIDTGPNLSLPVLPFYWSSLCPRGPYSLTHSFICSANTCEPSVVVPRSAIPSAQLDSYEAWEAGTYHRFSILFLALQHISRGTHKQNPSEYIHQRRSALG